MKYLEKKFSVSMQTGEDWHERIFKKAKTKKKREEALRKIVDLIRRA